MKNTFPKSERLCGAVKIQQFYAEGQKFTAWPLRVTWCRIDGPTEVLVWAPKAIFHHAVDRNLLRRRMREAWRLNSRDMKHGYRLAFNYIDHDIRSYEQIQHAVRKAVRRLSLSETDNLSHLPSGEESDKS